jgi:hypothetical protein
MRYAHSFRKCTVAVIPGSAEDTLHSVSAVELLLDKKECGRILPRPVGRDSPPVAEGVELSHPEN